MGYLMDASARHAQIVAFMRKHYGPKLVISEITERTTTRYARALGGDSARLADVHVSYEVSCFSIERYTTRHITRCTIVPRSDDRLEIAEELVGF